MPEWYTVTLALDNDLEIVDTFGRIALGTLQKAVLKKVNCTIVSEEGGIYVLKYDNLRWAYAVEADEDDNEEGEDTDEEP